MLYLLTNTMLHIQWCVYNYSKKKKERKLTMAFPHYLMLTSIGSKQKSSPAALFNALLACKIAFFVLAFKKKCVLEISFECKAGIVLVVEQN